MMTALRISSVGGQLAELRPTLRLSAYDRVASWLLALLLVCGALSIGLLVVWLGMRANFASFKSVPVHIVQPNGGGEGELGDQLLLEAASADEVGAESDLTNPQFQSTLNTLVDATALPEVVLADASFDDELSDGRGHDRRSSAAGPGEGAGKSGIPPHLRWEIDWGGGDTLATYARKLDFFGIELGAYGVPDPAQVTYIRNLSHVKPDIHVGPAKLDERLYMSWRSGALKDADRRLAAKALVPAGRILLQFFSAETEQLLLHTEQEFRGRDVSTIRKTRFGLRATGEGYEFFVIEQQYL